MFKRIDPVHIGPRTIKWLVPVLIVYCLVAFFLIGFQCQLPRPWVLSPAHCSTHGAVYYPLTISNILTDALLAFWIIPVLWGLQMSQHTKRVVMWLFGSRFALCIADVGRMFVIHKALQSEDQTRKTVPSFTPIKRVPLSYHLSYANYLHLRIPAPLGYNGSNCNPSFR